MRALLYFVLYIIIGPLFGTSVLHIVIYISMESYTVWEFFPFTVPYAPYWFYGTTAAIVGLVATPQFYKSGRSKLIISMPLAGIALTATLVSALILFKSDMLTGQGYDRDLFYVIISHWQFWMATILGGLSIPFYLSLFEPMLQKPAPHPTQSEKNHQPSLIRAIGYFLLFLVIGPLLAFILAIIGDSFSFDPDNNQSYSLSFDLVNGYSFTFNPMIFSIFSLIFTSKDALLTALYATYFITGIPMLLIGLAASCQLYRHGQTEPAPLLRIAMASSLISAMIVSVSLIPRPGPAQLFFIMIIATGLLRSFEPLFKKTRAPKPVQSLKSDCA